MILLVDAGNSCIKWLSRDKGQVAKRGHIFHRGCDRSTLGERLWGALEQPSQALIASVAGAEVECALHDWIHRTWGVTVRFIASEASGLGVNNAYGNPEQMGADRWVAMIGAKALSLQPCCIVDCGTAITIDALSADGSHQGGVIFPGVRLMRESLYRDTRRIPEADAGRAVIFGRNTRDCVWGGTTYAVTTAIDGITGRMEENMSGGGKRVLTGGDASLLRPHLCGDYSLKPDLIFHGLLAIARHTSR
jgi:type III pantothenate kinase